MEEEEQQSLLILSLTVNACTLCYFLSGRIVGCAVKRWRNASQMARALADLNDHQPWLAGKVVTEQLAAFVLIVMSVSALGGTAVATLPFRARREEPDDSLLQQILAMNIGRNLYMAMQDALLHNHLRNFRVDLIHHLVATSAYVVFLTYRENLFLSVTGAFMELNVLPLEVTRLMRRAGLGRQSSIFRGFTLASFLLTILSRGLLPLLFLSVALSRQSPFSMNYPPLTVFFLCAVFVSAINLWMVYRTLHRFLRMTTCAQPTEADAENAENVWTDLSNAAFRETSSGAARQLKLQRLNYGLLRSYDNRNLCNLDSSNEKINIANKKMLAKDLLMGGGQHRNNAAVDDAGHVGSASRDAVTSLDGSGESTPSDDGSLVPSNRSSSQLAFSEQMEALSQEADSFIPTELCRLIASHSEEATAGLRVFSLTPLALGAVPKSSGSANGQTLAGEEGDVTASASISSSGMLDASPPPSPSPSEVTVISIPPPSLAPREERRKTSGSEAASRPGVLGWSGAEGEDMQTDVPCSDPGNCLVSRQSPVVTTERRPSLLRTRSVNSRLGNQDEPERKCEHV